MGGRETRQDRVCSRGRWARAATLAVVAGLCLGIPRGGATLLSAAPEVAESGGAPVILVIAPRLERKLRALAGRSRSEVARCLFGYVHGDTAYVTRAVAPRVLRSSPTRLSIRPCAAGVLGVWHNHPVLTRSVRIGNERRAGSGQRAAEARSSALVSPASSGFRRPRSEPIASPVALCALSALDVRTTRRMGLPFAVVGVDADTWCWWTLEQVRRGAGTGAGAVASQLTVRR